MWKVRQKISAFHYPLYPFASYLLPADGFVRRRCWRDGASGSGRLKRSWRFACSAFRCQRRQFLFQRLDAGIEIEIVVLRLCGEIDLRLAQSLDARIQLEVGALVLCREIRLRVTQSLDAGVQIEIGPLVLRYEILLRPAQGLDARIQIQ